MPHRLFRLVGLALLLAATIATDARAQARPRTARELINQPRVLIISHRGDSKVAPENTLPAFASAMKAGADMVELDYHQSADGVPVVIHDGTLDRTTNARALWGGEKIRVDSKSLSELKLLDAGSWLEPKFAGTRLPTLVEAFELIQPESMSFFERKGGDPATCIGLLTQKQLRDRVVLQSFDWDFLAECHRQLPDLVIAALGDRELSAERLDQMAACGTTVVAWNERGLTPEGIAAVHARGLKACAWTVDDPQRIRELVAAKIDSIITNRPGPTRVVVESIR